MSEPLVVCIRPDGKVCGHEEKKHGHPHGLLGGTFCVECWDGKELIGPYIHAYNPHVWTGIGWLR